MEVKLIFILNEVERKKIMEVPLFPTLVPWSRTAIKRYIVVSLIVLQPGEHIPAFLLKGAQLLEKIRKKFYSRHSTYIGHLKLLRLMRHRR